MITDGLKEVWDDWKLSRQLLKIPAERTEEEQADMYIIGGIVRAINGELDFSAAEAIAGRVSSSSLSGRNGFSKIERIALSTFLVSGFAAEEASVEEAYIGFEKEKALEREKTLPGWYFGTGKIQFGPAQRKLLIGRAAALFTIVGNNPNNPQRAAKQDLLLELGNNIQPYADTLSRLYYYWGLN